MANKISYVDKDFPELAKNFKDQNKTHVPKSCKDYVELVCPCCKKVYNSSVVNYIKAGHVQCPICTDGFSYPEKMFFNVLIQLGIPFKYQYSPKWIKPMKYDFYFKLKGKKVIVELDGGLGHGNRYFKKEYCETSLYNDNYKDIMAKKHNITIIRIDCNYTRDNRFDFIKNNFILKLSNFLDLSNINWIDCHNNSLKSKFKEVIDVYKTKTIYLSEISEITHLKIRTIKKYLYEAMNVGIIEKNRLHTNKSCKISKYKKTQPIINCDYVGNENSLYCYEDNILFNSITDAALYYNYNRNSMYVVLKDEKYYRGRHFIKYKDLPLDYKFNRYIFPDECYSDGHIICQYTLDDKLKHVYIHSSELPQYYYYNNIWRACTNQRNSAYGYKWRFLDKTDEFELFEMIKENELARFYFCN